MTDKYKIASENLAKASDIAIAVVQKFPPKGWEENYVSENKNEINHFIDVYKEWKEIKAQNLPYKRENKLAKILKRKKINNIHEYDFVIDVIVPYQQEGLINEEEVVLLNKWLGDFENRKKI